MAVQEIPEISVSSKTQPPEVIAAVLAERGYAVDVVEQVQQQPTPAEVEAAEEAVETARVAKETTEEAARVAQEEKERKTRGEKRREARERDQAALREATEKSNRLEAQLSEFRESQSRMESQIEEMRRNPPKAEVEPPPPVAPARPSRADFMDADDPETAYEDALLEFGDKRREHVALLAERAKPKTAALSAKKDGDPPAVDPALTETLKDPIARRFYDSIERVGKTKTDIDIGKVLNENLPNVNEAIVTAVHQCDEPARIALYLAQHPEESKRIKALTDGKLSEDPRKVRIAIRELEKIEQLVAEEDKTATEEPEGSAGAPAADDELDPEVDASAARISPQPQRPAAPAASPAATPPKQPKKHTPIDPVGARGNQSAKRYEEMTPAEQKALSIDEVRKMRGLL